MNDVTTVIFLAMVLWGLIAGVIAYERGRSQWLYLLFGILLGPLAVVHALVQPRTFPAELRRQEAQGRHRCPRCSSWIYKDASVCPYCADDITYQREVEDLEAVAGR